MEIAFVQKSLKGKTRAFASGAFTDDDRRLKIRYLILLLEATRTTLCDDHVMKWCGTTIVGHLVLKDGICG